MLRPNQVRALRRRARRWLRLLGKKRGPTGDVYYGSRAKEYVKKRAGAPLYQAELAAVARLLRDVPDGVSVLDVPFGTGRFVPFYLKKKMSVSGLDASSEMIAAAREALGAQFEPCRTRLGDAAALPYPDESFDLLVCVRFLGSIIDFGHAKKALSEFARVTRGQFILSVNEKRDRALRWHYPREDETMGGKLYAREFAALLRDAGFRVVRKDGPLFANGRRAVYLVLCEKNPDRPQGTPVTVN